MYTSSLFLAALVGIAQAQTPQGFEPSVDTQLGVFFNSTAISTAGQEMSKTATASQPQIGVSNATDINSEDSYVFVMVDLDVPPAEGETERRTLLHAMVTDFKATSQSIAGGATLLASQERGPVEYIGPNPPATDSTPHRYVELLYRQPENLEVDAADFQDVQARIGFEIDQFAQENGFGEPLAANFFTVNGQGGASPTIGGFETATGSGGIVRNTLQPPPEEFTGAARKVDVPMGAAGLIGGFLLALF